jgi:16S rRNA (uracil1498-N3)-methyltransferase
MKHRLFVPPPLAADSSVELDPDRSHYLTRVLRLHPGAALVCMDGAGNAFEAELRAADRRGATLAIGALIEHRPLPQPPLHLVQGLLKGPAMDEVVQKATELGASAIWIVRAERSNVALDGERAARKVTHWRRVLEHAAQQSGQLHLPGLHGPMDLGGCLEGVATTSLVMLDPGGPPLPLSLPRMPLAVMIGPEGGWTEAERALAHHHGARRYGLGPLVLRAETAPLAALAAIRHGWHWAR